MTDNLQKTEGDAALIADAMALYTPPFRFYRGYIWDAKNNMVADDDAQDVALRVRGWGRISYMPNPEALQDAVGELFAKALTEYWQTHNAAVSGRGAKDNDAERGDSSASA